MNYDGKVFLMIKDLIANDNLDGIIILTEEDISDLERFNRILTQCTPQNYIERLPAIIDNYHRSLRYLNNHNRLYEELFLNNKK